MFSGLRLGELFLLGLLNIFLDGERKKELCVGVCLGLIFDFIIRELRVFRNVSKYYLYVGMILEFFKSSN